MVYKKGTYDSFELKNKKEWWMAEALGLLETIEEYDKTNMVEMKTQVHLMLAETKKMLQDWYEGKIEEVSYPSLWDTLEIDDYWRYNETNDDIFCTTRKEELPIWIDALELVIEFLFCHDTWEQENLENLYV